MRIAEPVPRFDPSRHRRRSVRLRWHDYAGGLYFVTICTHGRLPLFGEIVDGEMALSAAGDAVFEEWMRTGDIRAEVVLDAFVVMPNHVHGIIGIIAGTPPTVGVETPDDAFPTVGVGATGRSPLRSGPSARPGPLPKSLGALVAGFKSAVTKRVNAARGIPGAAVWQRNYWERVLRDDRELGIARRYVADNPLRWHLDRLHPDRTD
ncbi:MAG: transposase [Rhodothermales bacterium]